MIADAGGVALVQDPAGALYPSMPSSALTHSPSARAVPLAELADAICAAVDEGLTHLDDVAAIGVKSDDVAAPDRSDDDPRAGELTAITCPECGGTLWEHDEEGLARFKCHVGHAYSPDSLEASQSQSLEGALWAALRSLQERAELFRRLARRLGGEERLERKARDAEGHAKVLRELITAASDQPVSVGRTESEA
jgi:two-component system chemotaxis response regulator CheB